MPEAAPRILLDEDVWAGLAALLRAAGFDTVSAAEAGLRGLCDEELLAWAAAAGRAVLTHNAKDFAPLAEGCFLSGRAHSGMIIARQFGKSELLGRTLALLQGLTPELLANTLRFV